jgi:hypothetical protein
MTESREKVPDTSGVEKRKEERELGDERILGSGSFVEEVLKG